MVFGPVSSSAGQNVSIGAGGSSEVRCGCDKEAYQATSVAQRSPVQVPLLGDTLRHSDRRRVCQQCRPQLHHDETRRIQDSCSPTWLALTMTKKNDPVQRSERVDFKNAKR
jgi:hypothetical protein